jgi:hypothetical protein
MARYFEGYFGISFSEKEKEKEIAAANNHVEKIFVDNVCTAINVFYLDNGELRLFVASRTDPYSGLKFMGDRPRGHWGGPFAGDKEVRDRYQPGECPVLENLFLRSLMQTHLIGNGSQEHVIGTLMGTMKMFCINLDQMVEKCHANLLDIRGWHATKVPRANGYGTIHTVTLNLMVNGEAPQFLKDIDMMYNDHFDFKGLTIEESQYVRYSTMRSIRIEYLFRQGHAVDQKEQKKRSTITLLCLAKRETCPVYSLASELINEIIDFSEASIRIGHFIIRKPPVREESAFECWSYLVKNR